MINYWPDEQGIDLNLQVAQLFQRTYLKLDFCVYNQTSYNLAIDILNKNYKCLLLKIVLTELETMVLDILELNLTKNDIMILNEKIAINLVLISISRFQQQFSCLKSVDYINNISCLLRFEHGFLLDDLLHYLIFGNNLLSSNLFSPSETPIKYIEVLLDNVVIQVANLAFYELINSQSSLKALFDTLTSYNVCNDTYISIRSIAAFRNNLLWQNIISYYIKQPRIIYNNRYQVWFLSPYGMDTRYIYMSRVDDFKLLSYSQLLITSIIEFQDWLIPKILTAFLICSRILLYIFSNLIQYVIKLFVRSILVLVGSR